MTEAELWNTARTILTRKQYDALFMRYKLDLTSDTIAHHLGITRQAVDARLATARKRLADHITQEAA
jgi:DNA-directed RNA polymerase specialized sigma24 family protein